MDDDLKKQGYNKEEAYFHELNQALIEKMKQKKRDEKNADPFEPMSDPSEDR